VADVPPIANSCRLTFPTIIAPAFFKPPRDFGIFSDGTRSSKTAEAAVVRVPAVSMLSLSAIGSRAAAHATFRRAAPVQGREACANACSRMIVIKAFSLGL